MPSFLTPEWAAAVNEALAHVQLEPGLSCSIGHLIQGAGGREIGYVLRVADGHATASIGDASTVGDADVVLVHDTETATAIHRGEVSAQQAVEAGRLKVRGDAHTLVTHAAALAPVRAAIEAVSAE